MEDIAYYNEYDVRSSCVFRRRDLATMSFTYSLCWPRVVRIKHR